MVDTEISEKIKDLYNRGLIDRRTRNRMEEGANTGRLSGAVVQAIALLLGDLSYESKSKAIPEIAQIISAARLNQLLANYKFACPGTLNDKQLLEILEGYLTIYSDHVTYDVSIIAKPSTVNLVESLFESESVAFSAVRVRVRHVYVSSELKIPECIGEFLEKIRIERGVEIIKDPLDFIEKTKGSFVLIGENERTEPVGLNKLICDLVSNGSIIIGNHPLEFSELEAIELDQAVEKSPLKENEMVMMYRGTSIVKSGDKPVSEQIAECNRQTEDVGMIMICFEDLGCGDSMRFEGRE